MDTIAKGLFIILVLFCGKSLEENSGPGVGRNGHLRVCVVEGKGPYKKAGRYCPVVEKSSSGVECVIGTDRLDCLRRISKGTVDFSVFSSEDLLAARWADVDILVTDQLRFHKGSFEYEVVALVNNEIRGLENLRGSRLCHPGHGYEADWTDTLANFFESKIIPKRCDPTISLMENKLRATAEFFQAMCKAGPWVSDKARDRTLKSLYPSLCALCYDQGLCSSGDKYWGRRGPLHCLTENAGDVAWARLDDTRVHFGLVNVVPTANPKDYSYLCPDGTKRPLLNTTTPCVWIAKPWPVIGAKRKSAVAVSSLTKTLSHNNTTTWQSALLNVIELYNSHVEPMHPQIPVQDYLQHATGFQSANSFAECNPPRSITICTKNVVARHKCDWLAETARAHGVEPELQCISNNNMMSSGSEADSEKFCFEAIRSGRAEVTLAHPDWQITVKREYNIEPILFENTLIMNDLYIVVAVVRKNSPIKSFKDLRGKKACFPKYEGVAWNSVVHYFTNQKLFENVKCPYEDDVSEFFESACAPGASKDHEKLIELCGYNNEYSGEIGALKCLVDGKADVAFIDQRTLKNISDVKAVDTLSHNFKSDDYRILCPPSNLKSCYISWASIGHLYAPDKISEMRKQELINTFKELDQLFGKNFRSQTSAFTLYGPFDHQHDVIFQDRTRFLKTYNDIVESRFQYNYELLAKEFKFGVCEISSGEKIRATKIIWIALIALMYWK